MLAATQRRSIARGASALVAASKSSVVSSQGAGALRGYRTSPTCQAFSKFAMPAMSPTMTEGGIANWKKKEGDSFSVGDVLLEIETDKATMDVEAQDEGIVAKIIKPDGSKEVPVGVAIAILGEEGDDISSDEVASLAKEAENDQGSSSSKDEGSSKSESKSEKKTDEEPKKKDDSSKEKEDKPPAKKDESKKSSKPEPEADSGPREHVFASPIARRLAQERGIPLSKVKGSGPNGRIIKEDIEKYQSSSSSSSSSPASLSPAASSAPPKGEVTVPPYADVPLSNMRRTIAKRLTESKVQVPHYYVTAEINIDRLAKLREVFNKAGAVAESKGKDGVKAGTKISVNDFIIKASALALADVPEVNAGWHGEFIRQYSKADICMAVATPSGLITPIITDVGAKGLSAISAASKALAAKARDGKLAPHEYQGGSFTVSNLGMFGSVSHFTAIINPPQSAILAIGGTEKKLVLDESEERGFREAEVMKVTLSCDHRVVDGAIAARWMKSFKDYMENPLTFML